MQNREITEDNETFIQSVENRFEQTVVVLISILLLAMFVCLYWLVSISNDLDELKLWMLR